jgi:hypothetical protein
MFLPKVKRKNCGVLSSVKPPGGLTEGQKHFGGWQAVGSQAASTLPGRLKTPKSVQAKVRESTLRNFLTIVINFKLVLLKKN